MVRIAIMFAILAPSLASAADNALTSEEQANGWMLLFDGKTLAGWKRSDGKPSLRDVEQASINPHRCGAYMMIHEKDWGDFELTLDFKVSPNCQGV